MPLAHLRQNPNPRQTHPDTALPAAVDAPLGPSEWAARRAAQPSNPRLPPGGKGRCVPSGTSATPGFFLSQKDVEGQTSLQG